MYDNDDMRLAIERSLAWQPVTRTKAKNAWFSFCKHPLCTHYAHRYGTKCRDSVTCCRSFCCFLHPPESIHPHERQRASVKNKDKEAEKEKETDNECAICLEELPSNKRAVATTCGHAQVCRDCSAKLTRCAICNAVTSYVPLWI